MPKSDSPASHEHTIGSPQRRSVVTALALAPLAAAAPRAAWAEPTPRNPSASGQLRDWEQYVDLLKPAGKGIDLTWFPGDEQIRAEFYRQLVMNIAQAYVWYFQSSPEHPDWMPFENSIFLLQPNPDAVYHIAPVSGDGVYKVTGYRGTTRIMGFAVGRGMFGTVEPKPGFGRKVLHFSLRLVLVNFPQAFQHVLALGREVVREVHELPPAVAEAMGQNRLELLGGIARERIAHLDRR